MSTESTVNIEEGVEKVRLQHVSLTQGPADPGLAIFSFDNGKAESIPLTPGALIHLKQGNGSPVTIEAGMNPNETLEAIASSLKQMDITVRGVSPEEKELHANEKLQQKAQGEALQNALKEIVMGAGEDVKESLSKVVVASAEEVTTQLVGASLGGDVLQRG